MQSEARVANLSLLPRKRLRLYEFAEGLNIGENVVRARNGAVQRDLAPVDPGDGQPKRFAADQIRELRLPRMQDVFFGGARMIDQVSEQCAVGLIAPRALRRSAPEIEFAV